MSNETLLRWHEIVKERSGAGLEDILAEDVVFHSPVVHAPQKGKGLAVMYLTGAMHVLANDTFRYVREVSSGRDAVLEFVTEVDGIRINGVDMLHWNIAGKIDDFKVMIRPLKAINMVHLKMAELLESLKGNGAT